MSRLRTGNLHRFDSVTELLDTVREHYPDGEIWSGTEDDEFLLRVRSASVEFESLIVHFEGEKLYAVMLPTELDPSWLLQLKRALTHR